MVNEFIATDKKQILSQLREAMTRNGITDPGAIAEAGYFGMRLMLQSLERGAASRDEVRDFLETELHQGAEGRMAEARTLPLMRVRGGRVLEFMATAGN